ncbi:MAG: ATP-dependent DNA helicase RecG [Bacteroidales bacterium]|nr:ATP-dependent DNA helicase RecG [Bacteroidales bacterium]
MEIQFLPGVGPKRAELLRKELAVETVGDLLRLYPFRYIDKSSIVRICDARPDMAYLQVRARVTRVDLYGSNGQAETDTLKFNTIRRMSVWVGDGTGEMEMVFFKGIKWMHEKLKPGTEFIFFGKPTAFNGRINMVHPEVDAVPVQKSQLPSGPSGYQGQPGPQGQMGNHGTSGQMGNQGQEGAQSGLQGSPIRSGMTRTQGGTTTGSMGTMTGVYPSTERLKNAGVTGKVMNKIMEAALERGLAATEESLPEYIMKQCGLVPLHYALRNIHFPTDMVSLEKAKYRLKFEELFYLQLSLLKQKYVRSRADQGIMMPKVGEAFNLCYNALPFPLTGAQKRVITEIRNDMKSGHQMNRLLQGDVGSGKTMVAVLTALIAIGNGFQACIMAPTEVLAQQHYKNIQKFLAPTGVKSALLTGSSKTSERREVHAGLEDGSIGIIVGTHALIEDNVIFHNLGLAIIDEQHRFGVEQRSKLWRKAACQAPPHVLVMTATPIPRTLAMTLYGDLDVSVIDELPPGRKPVQTIHATEGKRPAMYRFMKDEIAKGRQIFIVYPLINETEKLDYQSLEAGAEEIMNKFPFPEYKTAVVHGKQLNDVKKFNMDAFTEGRADILVATSVIEVGVDVPNASVMIIESAERFGLSQLHQLRGRVGRGSEKSYCILMTGHKLSKESKHRIELMCATENGFELAEEDMKMRGPGDLEGTQQSGLPISLNIASLAKDGLILNAARDCADAILKEDPTLTSDRNQLLRKELRKEKYQIKDYSKIS